MPLRQHPLSNLLSPRINTVVGEISYSRFIKGNCVLLFLLGGLVSLICVGLEIYRAELLMSVSWDGFWDLIWFRFCFCTCLLLSIPPSLELCPEMASGCPRHVLAKGIDFRGVIAAEMNADMFVQLPSSLWLPNPESLFQQIIYISLPLQQGTVQWNWLVTAILLTQLFWGHSIGLKILFFWNDLAVRSLFLVNIQKKRPDCKPRWVSIKDTVHMPRVV